MVVISEKRTFSGHWVSSESHGPDVRARLPRLTGAWGSRREGLGAPGPERHTQVSACSSEAVVRLCAGGCCSGAGKKQGWACWWHGARASLSLRLGSCGWAEQRLPGDGTGAGA